MQDQLEESIQAARERHFPMHFPHQIEARPVAAEIAQPFINSHVQAIFGDSQIDPLWSSVRTRAPTWTPLQERYRQLHTEYILFYTADDTPIGWFTGETDDALTFYMRSGAFLEAYRGQGIYSSFLNRFLAYLKDVGYERATSHHLGTNKAILIPHIKAGFQICGLELHERFGAAIKMVYFFHDDRKAIYYNKYGHKRLHVEPEP